ncbi:sulfite exporter TauE/SafE family protein [Janthinobacterium fluminis]|uniref:Sulfite exporter TauE/SafE family protein n=1 Tax=Janthinobacterium fluminis TaxID=2987524 RepID=A0ABT5JZK1_9BURK|nr:sulfite exporter TauE/SafE family protein [Janthinobacterium fluminis]MDC8757896.1 sulfite exporter TauE/SafE family protein [Janthinobacterium fluminis]
MNVLNLLPVFLVGLAGSAHCIGMCGGIVGALSAAAAPRARPVIAIAVARPAGADKLLRVLAYNGGRIASYMAAGALAGGLAGGAANLLRLAALQVAFYWMANLMLLALGLYLMDAWRGLARLEAAGGVVWRRLQPLLKPLLPMDSPLKALAMGGLWGWVPCGMVYSVLLTAMLSGSALQGAAVMLAFGLGTLPTLLALGLLGARLRAAAQRRGVRVAGGLLVLAFGLLGLARAVNGLSLGWLDALCVTGHP